MLHASLSPQGECHHDGADSDERAVQFNTRVLGSSGRESARGEQRA